MGFSRVGGSLVPFHRNTHCYLTCLLFLSFPFSFTFSQGVGNTALLSVFQNCCLYPTWVFESQKPRIWLWFYCVILSPRQSVHKTLSLLPEWGRCYREAGNTGNESCISCYSKASPIILETRVVQWFLSNAVLGFGNPEMKVTQALLSKRTGLVSDLSV